MIPGWVPCEVCCAPYRHHVNGRCPLTPTRWVTEETVVQATLKRMWHAHLEGRKPQVAFVWEQEPADVEEYALRFLDPLTDEKAELHPFWELAPYSNGSVWYLAKDD